jgi:hypothetical protein
MVRPVAGLTLGQAVCVIDSSSGRGDGWSFAFAQWTREGDRRVLHVFNRGAFEGRFGSELTYDAVVTHVAAMATKLRVSRVFGDQYLSFALQSEFARFGISYVERTWSQPSKIESLSTVRRLLRERSVAIDPGEQADALRRELVSLREVLLPSKTFTLRRDARAKDTATERV